MLWNDGFFSYSSSMYQWEWGDVDKLDSIAHVSNNVAGIIATNMHQPSEYTQVILSLESFFRKSSHCK